MRIIVVTLMLVIGLIAVTGCDEDREVAEVAREGARQQAEQNVEMSRLNREVAETHRELANLHHDLGEQQGEVNAQRDQLERDRRQIAEQRQRDPIVAEAIRGAAILLGCLAPLALAALVIYRLRDGDEDREIGDLLIEELASDQPLLLPTPRPDARPPQAIANDSPRRQLPLPESD